ncbi:hypothetical protein O3M35_012124 [Rhynocoris fuscipes]|uniref:Uncharacterized protein n=1 Tax=Rhynocoris fuscipes TaxID=488301 RepID=A0AAW1CUT2_9HEMI
MTELERKICFMLHVKLHPCVADVVQKLIKSKSSSIQLEYKNFLGWLHSFVRYGRQKIHNCERFYWKQYLQD